MSVKRTSQLLQGIVPRGDAAGDPAKGASRGSDRDGNRSQEAAPGRNAADLGRRQRPKRVLVVDDERRNRHLLTAMLRLLGHESEEACDGKEALAKLTPDIDLVLLDVMMPRMDGYETATRIRSGSSCSDVPIIMVTALHSREARVRALEAGANDFIAKPLDQVELRVRTASLLRMKEAQDAIKQYQRELEETLKSRTAALRESEKRYRTLFQDSLDAILIVTRDGKILDVNAAFLALFGYTQEEIMQMNISDLYAHPEDRHRFVRDIEQNGFLKNYEWKARRKDGAERDCVFTSSVERDEAGNIVGYLSVIRDVTDLKLAEEERLRLATAIEQAAETVMITDTEGVKLYVNPAFERTSGYSRDEALGRNYHFLKSRIQGEKSSRDMWEAVKAGKVWSGRLVSARRDGSLYEEDATISPIKDKSGRIVNYVAVKRDVTTEVILEQQLRQGQKMKAIGTLAGGIAHDFNNILFAITGFAELALSEVPRETQARANLRRILDAADRAAGLVSQILTFSCQKEQEKRPVQMSPIVRETLRFLRATLPATIEIRENLGHGRGTVLADPTQIHQVLMNLCTNAAHAMSGSSGRLTVSVDDIDADSDFATKHDGMVPGAYVRLTVSDTGHGMPPEIMERIFEPYFTTKSPGHGTGLGLAQVHGIVKSHGGTMAVRSEEGQGTTFSLYFPACQDEIVPEEEHLAVPTAGRERILFVDDEPTLVELGEEILQGLGYHVVAKTTSREALELFRSDPNQFDLVITDMTMPKLTGAEFAEEVLSMRPNMPVIVCTGFSELIQEDTIKAMGVREILTKPISRNELAAVVRRVLD